MDVRLAGTRDGIEAAAEILERFGIRSIFVSAFSDPTTRARADRANPIARLAKPVADRRLVTPVSTALRDIPGGPDAGGNRPSPRTPPSHPAGVTPTPPPRPPPAPHSSPS